MIKTLRKKFIAVSMMSVIVVLALLIGLINYMNYRNIVNEADETLEIISDNGGKMPERVGAPDKPDENDGDGFDVDRSENRDDSEPSEKPDEKGEDKHAGEKSEDYNAGEKYDDKTSDNIRKHRRAEMLFDTRYFTVSFDENGKVVSSDTDRIAAIGKDDAIDIAKKIYESGRSKGFSGNYRFIKTSTWYTDGANTESVADNTDSTSEAAAGTDADSDMIICVDCYRSLGNFRSFLLYSVLVSLAGVLAVLILVIILSGRVVKPVAESYNKQKRFITDAGHELKTPLAVIDADISVIEMDGGKNEWLDDIKQQSKRLAGLTNELVYLSRMDEGRKVEAIEFPLSDVVSEEVQSFAARAKVENKDLTTEIEPAMSYTGDQKMITELVSILMDNAIKYSSENGRIDVMLRKTGTGADLIVSNDVNRITKEQTDRMFDRFYRADESRSEKAGYGLGLSIAKAVCEAHDGSIKAEPLSDGKKIRITARLS